MRTAIGRMAGPLKPPMPFDSSGRRVSTSMAIARNVFTSDTASAPASSAARAHDVEGAPQAASELDAALLDVRARDVQLDRGHALGVGQHARDLRVLVDR